MPTRVPAVPPVPDLQPELRDWLHLVRVRLDEAVGAGGVPFSSVDHALTNHVDVTLSAVAPGNYLRAETGSVSISRVTSGLVFRDDFDRGDGSTIGNGWSEQEDSSATLQIVSQQVKSTSGAGALKAIYRTSPALPDDVIIQCNMSTDNNGQQVGPFIRGTTPTNYVGYNLTQHIYDTGNNFLYLKEGTTTQAYWVDTTYNRGDWVGVRLVGELSGSSYLLRGYSGLLSGSTDLGVDLPQRVSWADTTSVFTDTTWGIIINRGVSYADTFFVCGRNVTVTNVPSGYKVQVDSRTAVVSDGSDVVVDVDGWALPCTTIKVLDATDTELASLTPSGGIYGGDVYDFDSSGLGSWVNVGAAQIVTDINASLDHGLFLGLSDDDHPQYLLIDGTRAMTGGLTLGGDLMRVGADQNYVVDSVRKHIFKVGTTEVFRVEPTQVYLEYTLKLNTADAYLDAGYAVRYSGSSNHAYLPYPAADQSLIRSAGNFVVQIDADNNATTNVFQVRKDASTYSGGTLLFTVKEDGSVIVGSADPGDSLGFNALLRVAGGVVFQQNSDDYFGLGIVHANDASGNWAGFEVRDYGAGTPYVQLTRSRGTLSSPTAVQSGDPLGAIYGSGQYNTLLTQIGGWTSVQFYSRENFDGANQGSELRLTATRPGTTIESEVIRANSDYVRFQPWNSGPRFYMGSGVPSGLTDEADGDFYFRTGGGAGTSIYKLISSTWTALA